MRIRKKKKKENRIILNISLFFLILFSIFFGLFYSSNYLNIIEISNFYFSFNNLFFIFRFFITTIFFLKKNIFFNIFFFIIYITNLFNYVKNKKIIFIEKIFLENYYFYFKRFILNNIF